MRPEYDGIDYLDVNDLLFGHYLNRTIEYLDTFDEFKEFTNVNEIIELYNVSLIINNKDIKPEFTDKYRVLVKTFMPKIAKFFKAIDDTNFIEINDKVCSRYVERYWELFSKFKTFENVSSSKFSEYIERPTTTLYIILKQKDIVKHYDAELTECLRHSNQTADIIIHNFMQRFDRKEIWYLPNSLQPSEFDGILLKYVNSEHPGLNALGLIGNFQSTKECPVSDKLRYAARKRCEVIWNDKSINAVTYTYGVGVCFKDMAEISDYKQINPREFQIYYNRNWIRDNLDYATLLNNFIYLFGYVDKEFRSTFPTVTAHLEIFERFLGTNGVRDYVTGSAFEVKNMKSSAEMQGYVEELKRNGIRLEEIFQWFFDKYLVDEFNRPDFVFNAPSENSTILEKCKNLPSEMDGILKQFTMYVEDGEINRELLEMSSKPVSVEQIPSLIKDKYAYISSEELKKELYFLFSDQCMLHYVNKYGSGYKNFVDLLVKEKVSLDDYTRQDDKNIIKWLHEKGALVINEDKLIHINVPRVFILKDLNEHEVICPHYYEDADLKMVIENLVNHGDINFQSSLFSKPEQNYLNYMLNKAEFSNGLDLRNKYIHSTYPTDVEVQKRDYVLLLKIMVLVIIKLNEEFCLKDEEM